MEAGILTAICDAFRDALLPIAPQLIELLHPTFMVFLKLAAVLLITGMMFGAPGYVMSGLFLGTLAIGFSHFCLLFGPTIAENFFSGTVRVAQMMGAPGVDPSGLVDWGWAVADPIFKALDAQGVFSYVTSPVLHLTFEAAGWAIAGSYIILAALEVGFLIMSYVLVGLSPFFLMFSVLPILQALTMRWVQLVFATMSGLFVTLFIALGMRNIGGWLLSQLQAHFLAPGVTLVANDYWTVLGIGVVLIIAFAWIPMKFASEAAGVSADIIRGAGAMILGAASAVVSTAQSIGQGQRAAGGGGNSSSSSASGSSSSGGSGRGMGPAQEPRYSAWQ